MEEFTSEEIDIILLALSTLKQAEHDAMDASDTDQAREVHFDNAQSCDAIWHKVFRLGK